MSLLFHDTTLVVLVGGQGKRLGRGDKAFVEVAGRPLLEWVLDLADRFPAVLLVGEPRPRLASVGLPVVPDIVPKAGAPGGVHAGLAHAGTPWVCVLACDMPEVRAEALDLLWSGRDGHDAVVPRVNGRLHPLHAFYRVEAALGPAHEVACTGGSLHALLERLDTRELALPWTTSVANVNRPEDLEAAASRLRRRPPGAAGEPGRRGTR